MNFHNEKEKAKLKQIKWKDKYEIIKSDDFIQKVFDLLRMKKTWNNKIWWGCAEENKYKY